MAASYLVAIVFVLRHPGGGPTGAPRHESPAFSSIPAVPQDHPRRRPALPRPPRRSRPAMRLARSLAPLVAPRPSRPRVAACAAEATPGWTFAPTPTPTIAASVGRPRLPRPPAPRPRPARRRGTPSAAPGGVVTLRITRPGHRLRHRHAWRSRPTRPSRSSSPTTTPGSPTTWRSTRTPRPARGLEGRDLQRGGRRTYDVPALPAGTYGFVCTVHPNMIGTLTAK